MPKDNEDPPATSADIQAVLAKLEGLRAELERLTASAVSKPILSELERLRREVIAGRERSPPPPGSPPGPAPPSASSLPEHLVTLDQIAAMVHRSKRSLERYVGKMPAPRIRGRRGRPHLWAWSEVRPWLEATFEQQLPPRFPGLSH